MHLYGRLMTWKTGCTEKFASLFKRFLQAILELLLYEVIHKSIRKTLHQTNTIFQYKEHLSSYLSEDKKLHRPDLVH